MTANDDVGMEISPIELTARLDNRRDKFLIALLQSPSVLSAAKMCDIPLSTAWRMVNDPEFAVVLNQTRRAMRAQALARLVGACTTATDALEEIAANKKAPPQARVAAARTILEFVVGSIPKA